MNLYDSLQERLENVRLYSNYFACTCVFHDDDSPSMFVYEDGFRCAACGKRGSLQFLDRQIGSHYRVTRSHSLKPQVLPKWRRWEQQYGDLNGIANAAHKHLLKFPQFQSYFKKRKIEKFIDKGCLGFLDGWCTFPVISPSGSVIDIVVRRASGKSDTRYVISPNNSGDRHLYVPNYQRIEQSSSVYVVFGIIDAISLELLGLPVVTGITGKSLSPDLLKPLNKKFIIIPDDGEEREARILANKLGWRAQVKALHYDDGCKDVDDERVKFGNQHLLQLIGA